MKTKSKSIPKENTLVVLLVLLIAFLGYGIYQYRLLRLQNESLQGEKAALQNRVADLEGLLGITRENLSDAESENVGLSRELSSEKEKVGALGEELGETTKTVETLEKLAQTDKELLQKYSKVYFLNEHYVPESLSNIDIQYIFDVNKEPQIHTSVLPYLEEMLKDTAASGNRMYVVSAYRSFGTQSALKSGYTVIYGAGTANQFSADQGYSEHQLGTAVDLTTLGIGTSLDGFENTSAYSWLKSNAHNYGFVLSYPKGNSYYIFEPWHWRFVGVELAKKLHNEGKYFYDLDQREINEYLISIFD